MKNKIINANGTEIRVYGDVIRTVMFPVGSAIM